MLEQVDQFKYLGSTISSDGNSLNDVKHLDRRLDLDLKKRVVKCLIWSTVKYASETWTSD